MTGGVVVRAYVWGINSSMREGRMDLITKKTKGTKGQPWPWDENFLQCPSNIKAYIHILLFLLSGHHLFLVDEI